MSNRAFNTEKQKVIHSAHFTQQQWAELKKEHRKSGKDNPLLTCSHNNEDGTVCGQRLMPKTRSDTGTQYFSHYAKNDQCKSKRDRMHDDLEYIIQKTLFEIGIEADLEKRLPYLETHRRPDILFEVDDKIYSIEVQITNQNLKDYVTRTQQYREAGVNQVLWVSLQKELLTHKHLNSCVIQDEYTITPTRKDLKELIRQQVSQAKDYIFFATKEPLYTKKRERIFTKFPKKSYPIKEFLSKYTGSELKSQVFLDWIESTDNPFIGRSFGSVEDFLDNKKVIVASFDTEYPNGNPNDFAVGAYYNSKDNQTYVFSKKSIGILEEAVADADLVVFLSKRRYACSLLEKHFKSVNPWILPIIGLQESVKALFLSVNESSESIIIDSLIKEKQFDRIGQIIRDKVNRVKRQFDWLVKNDKVAEHRSLNDFHRKIRQVVLDSYVLPGDCVIVTTDGIIHRDEETSMTPINIYDLDNKKVALVDGHKGNDNIENWRYSNEIFCRVVAIDDSTWKVDQSVFLSNKMLDETRSDYESPHHVFGSEEECKNLLRHVTRFSGITFNVTESYSGKHDIDQSTFTIKRKERPVVIIKHCFACDHIGTSITDERWYCCPACGVSWKQETDCVDEILDNGDPLFEVGGIKVANFE